MAESEDRAPEGAEQAPEETAAEAPAEATEAPAGAPEDTPGAVQDEASEAAQDEAPAAAHDEAPPAAQDEPPAEVDAAEAPPAETESETPAAEAPDGAAPEPAEEPVRRLAELAADARYSATGKRKSSVARVIIRPGTGRFELNGRDLETYFPRLAHRAVVMQPLEATGIAGRIDVRARIHGGGISGQADALRHGISKALIEAEPSLRTELKRRQFLTRDPRVKERKKAGLKKARKRPQFSKR
jgi:small subunit ribosomal protein S9